MPSSTAALKHRTVPLPVNLAAFRSVRSETPPFESLLAFLRRESGIPTLAFSDVFLSRSTFAKLRNHTRTWLLVRNDGDASQLDAMTWPGVSGPLLSGHLAFGVALVKEVA